MPIFLVNNHFGKCNHDFMKATNDYRLLRFVRGGSYRSSPNYSHGGPYMGYKIMSKNLSPTPYCVLSGQILCKGFCNKCSISHDYKGHLGSVGKFEKFTNLPAI